MDQVPLRAGMKVADCGFGVGEHALLLTQRLGEEGAVYAFEIKPNNVEALARTKARENIENLFPMHVNLNEPLPLKDAMLNLALLSNTLPAVRERATLLSELKRVLVANGLVFFVDWAHSFNNMGPRDEDVIYPGDAVRLFESFGFSVGNMLPAGTHHYAFIARKAA